MYETILMTLETTPTDRPIIDHVKQLARAMNSRVVLLHVATGLPAQWHGANAIGQEIDEDRAYLKQICEELVAPHIPTTAELAFGDPVAEIVKWARTHPCDLIAMSTHGHHIVADLLLGSTASRVQHSLSTPVLLLRAK